MSTVQSEDFSKINSMIKVSMSPMLNKNSPPFYLLLSEFCTEMIRDLKFGTNFSNPRSKFVKPNSVLNLPKSVKLLLNKLTLLCCKLTQD